MRRGNEIQFVLFILYDAIFHNIGIYMAAPTIFFFAYDRKTEYMEFIFLFPRNLGSL